MIRLEMILFEGIPLVISGIALCVSIYSAWKILTFNETSFKRVNRYDLNKSLLDIDMRLIDYPEIWAVFDTHPLSKTKSTDPLASARREGYIYLCFSLFDAVFDYYENLIRRNKTDKEFWKSWERSIFQFFKSSQEARSIWSESRTQEIYPAKFTLFINNMLSDIEKS